MTVCKMESESYSSGGLKLNFKKFGNGGRTPILLLHGLLYFSYDWIDIASLLAGDREVIAPDLRGFGESDWSADRNYRVSDFAQDVVSLVETRNWDRVVLVGHSMGGRVACCAAQMLGRRAAGLLLVDSPPENAATGARRIGDQMAGTPTLFPTVDDALKYFPATPWKNQFDPARRQRFEAYLREVPGGYTVKRDPYFSEIFYRLKVSWPYHCYEGDTWPWGREFDMWQALCHMQCPTTMLAGRAGDIFSPETVQKMERLGTEKNSRVRTVSHYVHHNIPGKAPEILIGELRSLLKVVSE